MYSLKFSLPVFCLAFQALLPLQVFSQVLSGIEIARLDSLMLRGDSGRIQQIFDNKDNMLGEIESSKADLQDYAEVKNYYLRMNSIKVSDYTPEKLQTLFETIVEKKDSFSQQKAGTTASVYFQRFLAARQQEQNFKALKYYHLAYVHKIREYKLKRRHLEQRITQAEKFIDVLKPKIVIPMHYWSDQYKTDFLDFLRLQNKMGKKYQIRESETSKFEISFPVRTDSVRVISLKPGPF